MDKTVCYSNRHKFCYVCACYIKSSSQITPFKTDTNINNYKIVYNKKQLKSLDYNFVASSICSNCRLNLSKIANSIQKKDKPSRLRAKNPAKWKKPLDPHNSTSLSNCYICQYAHKINTDLQLKRWPENIDLDLDDFSVVFNKDQDIDLGDYDNITEYTQIQFNDDEDNLLDPDYESEEEQLDNKSAGPSNIDNDNLLTQQNVSDIIKKLNLDKERGELLASILKRLKITTNDFRITFYRNRTKELKNFFKTPIGLPNTVYLDDLSGYLEYCNTEFNSNKWRLFFDSNTTSFKCCLIYNRENIDDEKKPIIPLIYSKDLDEYYEDLKTALELIHYNDVLKCYICCDFKILNILVGLKSGNCKYQCLFCTWDSRNFINQYKRGPDELRDYQLNKFSIINKSLVPIDKILLPSLHIKLGVFSKFVQLLAPKYKTVKKEKVKISDGNQRAFDFLIKLFPRKTESKIIAGKKK